ncbi:adhesion G protein-coupled receptor L2-like isoform X2 [Anneissia japonica]|uniref:adhesion G protein-coupled receptor L2-like isoform X2 n=1 Tax=Anneissia japonica TaxID=1529436 RepID=UPI0014259FD5|nr:adhesion G protein-coupled receptor L2-like isoform X2 [Anneissia japonica]
MSSRTRPEMQVMRTAKIVLIFYYFCRINCSSIDCDIKHIGSCYHVIDSANSWNGQVNECLVEKDSQIIKIDSVEEQAFITETIQTNLQATNVWIGLTDQFVEGEFRWQDNTSIVAYDDFGSGQPDNGWRYGEENCVEMIDGNNWNDLSCTSYNKGLCELNCDFQRNRSCYILLPELRTWASQVETCAANFIGNLSNTETDAEFQFLASRINLSEQFWIGSDHSIAANVSSLNSSNSTEDCFSINNQQPESIACTTLLPAVCEVDCEAYFNNSCYFPNPEYSFWLTHQSWCQNKGTNLVAINSEEEQLAIDVIILSSIGYSGGVWIGLTDEVTEGIFRWADGSIYKGFSNFRGVEPNNGHQYGRSEDCVLIDTLNEFKWYDMPCDQTHPTICEKEDKSFLENNNILGPCQRNNTLQDIDSYTVAESMECVEAILLDCVFIDSATDLQECSTDGDYLSGRVAVLYNLTSLQNFSVSASDKPVTLSLNVVDETTGPIIITVTYWNSDQTDNVSIVDNTDITNGSSSPAELGTYRMVTDFLSISVFSINRTRLQADVQFTMPIVEEVNISESQQTLHCAFLDPNYNTSLWSFEGCETNWNTLDGVVHCTCNHLTSFGALMHKPTFDKVPNEEHGSKKSSESISDHENHSSFHEKLLSKLTLIGFGLSTTALTLTAITYAFFRELWKSLRNAIHKNLVGNLLIFYIVFIGGIQHAKGTGACKFVAVSLHLFLLNSLMWMLGEAVFLIFKVVKKTPSKFNKLRNYLIVCYGTPVAMVAVLFSFGNETYAPKSSKICWLSDLGCWAVVVPVIIIEIFNVVSLGFLIRIIYQRSRKIHTRSDNIQRQHNKTKSAVKGTLMLLPLLGIAWVTGPLLTATDSIVIEYIFVITNSLQGVFIFIVYCVMDNEVRAASKRWIAKKRSVALHTNRSSNTQPKVATIETTGGVSNNVVRRPPIKAWAERRNKSSDLFEEERETAAQNSHSNSGQ